MRVYQIRVEIYEVGTTFPIVVHLFHGRSAAHAERIHRAHRAADRFLRQCEDSGLYGTAVPCRAVTTRGWATLR